MLLAIISTGISALPWYFSILLCSLVIFGTAFQIVNLRAGKHCSLFWRAGDDHLSLNFGPLEESLSRPRCHQQGPLWIISALDASRKNRYFVFLPDTINDRQRRLLRLVAATPKNPILD